MRLTTKARYAVMAMVDLAGCQDRGPVKLADIAERQELSLSYLERSSRVCVGPAWSEVCAAPAGAICRVGAGRK